MSFFAYYEILRHFIYWKIKKSRTVICEIIRDQESLFLKSLNTFEKIRLQFMLPIENISFLFWNSLYRDWYFEKKPVNNDLWNSLTSAVLNFFLNLNTFEKIVIEFQLPTEFHITLTLTGRCDFGKVVLLNL